MLLLSFVKRSDKTILEDGLNIDFNWNKQSTTCIVLTSKGYLHYYDLVTSGNDSYSSPVYNSVRSKSIGIDNPSITSIVLKFRAGLEVDAGVSSYIISPFYC